jgi:hypothetical protein
MLKSGAKFRHGENLDSFWHRPIGKAPGTETVGVIGTYGVSLGSQRTARVLQPPTTSTSADVQCYLLQ